MHSIFTCHLPNFMHISKVCVKLIPIIGFDPPWTVMFFKRSTIKTIPTTPDELDIFNSNNYFSKLKLNKF